MKRTLLLSGLLALCLLLSRGLCDAKVLRVRDGKIVTFSQMVEDVKKADIVFVGEIHDAPGHHRMELDVIRGLHEADIPMAVGLEMFRADSQGALDEWVRGKLTLARFLAAYYDNWRISWALYESIFHYARDHELPLIGLSIPDEIAAKVGKGGFADLTPGEKKQLPPGISCNVDPTYMDFIRRAYAEHGFRGREFVNFCEVQMVWDKSMAWHLIAYLKKNQGRTVVVMAGVGHAWKRGIPGQVALASKFNSIVILPLIPGQIEKRTVTINDADYVVLE